MSHRESVFAIEFRNNGRIDSLTHTPAPDQFLRALEREYARWLRSGNSISVISLTLQANYLKTDHFSYQLVSNQLIQMAHIVEKELRHVEFFTRISELGFWICVLGQVNEAQACTQRVLDKVSVGERQQWRASYCECAPFRDFNSWLKELDRIHFATTD